uniref:Uncharacterized protein n=1 Tax=Globisporangium ultimum (strain ATCC 200006 / CBS 805.95 / DAOM BR144) TaxID=431595 RepID=K3WWV7_GLOUD
MSVHDSEARLAQHHHDAAQAKAAIANALSALQTAQDQLLATKLENAISAQRNVELEALNFTKNVNSLYQRAARWKSEQKRLRGALEVTQTSKRIACNTGLEKFEDWAAATEMDLRGIAGNLEYVCSVLEKEQGQNNSASSRPAASSTIES